MTLALLCGGAWGQDVSADKPFVPAGRWALVVGASAYKPEIGPLRYTSKEARDFAGELKDRLGFTDDSVKLLVDGGTPEEAPTSAHILGALDQLLADPRLDKANLFVFYFSGHGVGTLKGDFLLPSDASPDRIEESGVPVKDVIERIVRRGLKNVLFIADACRAGQANDFGAQFYDLCRQANLAVILGCEPGKRSYEYPAFKSGAFTHFLIQSLQDPALRDESGTLWASKVGQSVQKQVHDYTEPDYGKFAQNPVPWGEQSTLDVLLATYPQKPVSDFAVQSFKKSAEKLGKQEFAAAMVGYAAQLQNADRFDQSVEILKAVDQLGELTPLGRYLLGNSLDLLGRTGESSKVFDGFASEPDGYYKDLSLISSKSRTIPPALRVQAATRILHRETGWTEKMLANIVVEGCGSYEQKLRFAREFAAVKADPRRILYARACLADTEGRWKDAIQAFEEAMHTAGDLPKDRELFLGELRPMLALNDLGAVKRWAERGLKMKGCETICNLENAYLAKLAGDHETRIRCLRAALAGDPEPTDIWRAAEVAGADIGSLKEDLKRATAAHPYAWRMRVLAGFLRQVDGDSKAVEELSKGVLYREDTVTFLSDLFALMTSLLEEGVRMKRVDEMTYRREVELGFLSMLGSVPDFGYDADLWGQFASYGLLNERSTQVEYLLSKHIPFAPKELPIAVRPFFLLSAMNRGNDQVVRLLDGIAFEPSEGDDERWLSAAYWASRGRERESLALISHLQPASANIQPRMEALKTYLLAKTGRSAEARKRLKSALDDMVVRGYYGLAWAALGDWKKAEPLLLEQATARDWAFLFMTAHALRVLDAHYQAVGKDDRMLALSAGASQPSNPLFASISFAKKPGIAQFAGKALLNCVIEDDVLCAKSLSEEGKKTYGFGKLSLSISPAGALSGSFTDDQKHLYPFSGKVDAFGNLRGEANLAGRKFRVAAKLAPPAMYKSFAGFKQMGQVIEFVDTNGYRVAVISRP